MLRKDLGRGRTAWVSPQRVKDNLCEPRNSHQFHFCLNRKDTGERILGKKGQLSQVCKTLPFPSCGKRSLREEMSPAQVHRANNKFWIWGLSSHQAASQGLREVSFVNRSGEWDRGGGEEGFQIPDTVARAQARIPEHIGV